MKNKFLLALALLIGFVVQANAAQCFWVTGTAWNNSANWSATDAGGTGGTCLATSGIPKNAGDIAKLATAAPGSTTLTLDIDISIAEIDMGALTGSSAFDDGGHAITQTTGFICSGSGTRSLTATGTWTFPMAAATASLWNCTTTTSLTQTLSSITINVTGNSTANHIVDFGSTNVTIGTLSFGADTGRFGTQLRGSAGTVTLTNLSLAAGQFIEVVGTGYVVTNNINWVGTATSPILIESNSQGTQRNFSLTGTSGVATWLAVRDIAFTSHNVSVTGYMNLGNNTGVTTVSLPSLGGVGIIGD